MENNNSLWGCLVVSVVLFILFLVLRSCLNNLDKEYLVEQTNYIHSTNNKKKCRFIAIAKDRNYEISRITKDLALKRKKNICKECYPEDVYEKYNSELKTILQKEMKGKQYSEDNAAWENIGHSGEDFSKLFVYMETNGTLHILGNCYKAEGKLERINFADIDSIETTCGNCVGREYCDFIYKKLYEGIYDANQIKEVEYDEDY